jgi:TrmH family RNA methyltransferase
MISKSQLKYIQSLGQKKYRDEEGVFIAEGPKLVKEFLQDNSVVIKHLYGLEEWIKENESVLNGVETTAIAEKELERISQLTTPNKVVAVIRQFKHEEPVVKGTISLVLDAIQDPGNLGSIIRIADWFGLGQIICSSDCVDMYNPKLVQATMGSLSRVNVFYTDLPEWLKKQEEIKIYATMLEGRDVRKIDGLTEALVIIGNESKGVGEELLQYASEKITIPKKGKAESLNAAVATGIVLSHIV